MPEMSSGAVMAGEAFVPIGVNLGPLGKGLGQAGQMLSGWAGKMASLYAVYKIIGFGKESLAEAANEEKALFMLQAALQATGQASEGAYNSLVKLTNEISRQTEYSEEALREAVILALTLGNVKAEGIDPVIKASIGWATIMKVNVIDAMRQLIQSLGEGRNIFIKWGIVFEEGTSRQEKLNILVRAGLPGFELQRAAMSGIAGALDNQAKAWGDFKEQAGYGIAYYGALNILLQDATRAMDGQASSAMDLGAVLGIVFSSFVVGLKTVAQILKQVFLGIRLLVRGIIILGETLAAVFTIIGGLLTGGFKRADKAADFFGKRIKGHGAAVKGYWSEMGSSAADYVKMLERIGFARVQGRPALRPPGGPPVPFEQPEAKPGKFTTLPASALGPNPAQVAALLQQIEQNTRVDPAARLP